MLSSLVWGLLGRTDLARKYQNTVTYRIHDQVVRTCKNQGIIHEITFIAYLCHAENVNIPSSDLQTTTANVPRTTATAKPASP